MKNRLNLIVLAILVVIGVLIWTTVRDRKIPAAPIVALTPAVAETPQRPLPPIDANWIAQQSTAAEKIAPVVDAPAVKSQYTAQPGDTVSNLAAELPGGDKKINRDAVINANPSLQNNPDRVLAGKTYQIPADASAPSVAAPISVPTPVPVAIRPPITEPNDTEVVHQLKYNARSGDTASTLAGALLGSDTKENRDAIIGANAPLQNNPDHVVAGQTYRIPVSESQPLATATPSALQTAARPTTQPDADNVVIAGSPRELRYVAQAGDNVSTLATALLGSDTVENRAAITNSNESLKNDPDRVVAGQTYWISAPAAPKP